VVWRLRRRRREATSPRIRMLELAVASRYAASRMGLLANRVRRTYMRTGDESLKAMLEKILALQAVFEIMAVRLETLAEVGAVSAETLALLRNLLREARRSYGELGPSVTSIIGELDNMIASVAAETGVEMSAPELGETRLDEEAKKILEEARLVAEERLREYTGATG
jgi:division protein CdvB (Snf7/Vps24/ESCRT-III family)